MNQNKREYLIKIIIAIVCILEIIFIGIYNDWNYSIILLNICFAIPISVGIYIFLPRKCVNCSSYMKIQIFKNKSMRVTYTCGSCGSFIDTGVELGDSANS